jgi:hypothetical protein
LTFNLAGIIAAFAPMIAIWLAELQFDLRRFYPFAAIISLFSLLVISRKRAQVLK